MMAWKEWKGGFMSFDVFMIPHIRLLATCYGML